MYLKQRKLVFTKIMPASAMKTCIQIAERSLSSAKLLKKNAPLTYKGAFII